MSDPRLRTRTSRRDLQYTSIENQAKAQKRIVILGGGYAGARLALDLSKDGHYEVILVDQKEYTENTISMLRALSEPEMFKSVELVGRFITKHGSYLGNSAQFVQGTVLELLPEKVILNNSTIFFDYCIVSTGSSYSSGIKSDVVTDDFRVKQLLDDSYDLSRAENVLIVGGGLVGVELAGEVIVKYPQKKVTLVTRGSKVLARLKNNASSFAQTWLESKGVELIFDSEVKLTKDPKTFKIKGKKTTLTADKIFWCIGFKPNSKFMQKNFSAHLNKSGFIQVNSRFQLEGYPNILAVGDVVDLPEEKTAERAIAHRSFVTKHVFGAWKKDKEPTKSYKPPRAPPMAIISLGPNNGFTTVNNSMVNHGYLSVKGKNYYFSSLSMNNKVDKKKLKKIVVRKEYKPRITVDEAKFKALKVAILHYDPITNELGTALAHHQVQLRSYCKENHFIALRNHYEDYPGVVVGELNLKVENTLRAATKNASTLILHSYAAEADISIIKSILALADDVEHVILLHQGFELEQIESKSFAKLESVVKKSNKSYTILRYLATYEQIYLRVAKYVKTASLFKFPFQEHKMGFIAEADIVDAVLRILEAPEQHYNKTYTLTGEMLTGEEVAQVMSKVLHTEIHFANVEPEDVSTFLNEFGINKNIMAYWLAAWKHPELLAIRSRSLKKLSGKKTWRLECWLELNSHYFAMAD